MTPFSFEWHWNAEYLVFMGLLYIALTILGTGLIYTVLKTWMDLEDEGHDQAEIPTRRKYSSY